MKRLLLLALAGLLVSASASAEVVTNGLSIGVARRVMEAAGYKQTGLDMLPNSPNEGLQCWCVGQGVLIIGYSTTSKVVTGMGFSLCDERPKALRKTFDFEVTSFDAHRGLMTIKATKSEPNSTAGGNQLLRSQTNSTPSADGSHP